ncbi:MAG: hypothetical protein IJ109_05990 [Firmicutes bacterium]|nr:hypothetical protein [Bacillota bacterium]
MKKKLTTIIIMTIIMTLAAPAFASAEVRGSTQFLINQAKSTKYTGKTLSQVKAAIKSQGYNGWRMSYDYDWCAWYVANIANAAYVGNYSGMKQVAKSTYANIMAENFARFNGTTKKNPSKYTPKAGDIVVENNNGHIGIMISSKKAVYGNDGTASWRYTTVKIRKPHDVTYYVPRANWYQVHYSDGLASTTITNDMKINPPHKATFGKSVKTSAKKFKRQGYTYSYWYIYRQDYSKENNRYTNQYYSKNTKTGKYAWVPSGTKNYKKYKKKVGSKIKFGYNAGFAGAKIILTPVWTKSK